MPPTLWLSIRDRTRLHAPSEKQFFVVEKVWLHRSRNCFFNLIFFLLDKLQGRRYFSLLLCSVCLCGFQPPGSRACGGHWLLPRILGVTGFLKVLWPWFWDQGFPWVRVLGSCQFTAGKGDRPGADVNCVGILESRLLKDFNLTPEGGSLSLPPSP